MSYVVKKQIGAGVQGRRNEGVKECKDDGVQKCRSEVVKGVNK